MKSVAAFATILGLTASGAAFADTPTKAEVVKTYADIGAAKYQDSLIAAQALQAAVDALITAPSAETMQAAKHAWLRARVPYQQSEVYRFGNPIVDDWEGKVNAWPLDEGLIDYVDPSSGGASDENALAVLNVIAHPNFELSGKPVDASKITPKLLGDTLHEADGIEANVATGYHAIEFLLWGQDLNGTNPGAGNRPWTDYAKGDACTHDNCDRRGDYLKAATDLLVSDLDWMAAQWKEGGAARVALSDDPSAGITAMITGMGSLSYGELGGERMRLGLMLNDPEEEHDCFSDNTHNSHFYDALGVQETYLANYTRIDGSTVSGPSLSDLVGASDPALDAEMKQKLGHTMLAMTRMKTAAEAGFTYDRMLARGDAGGEALVMGGVNALIDQTKTIERIAAPLGLDGVEFEGSDSLDKPSAVFQ
jgi:putative iron-regulated protein